MKKRDIDEIRQEAEREMRKSAQTADDVKNAIMNFTLFTFEEDTLKIFIDLLSEIIHLIERRVRLKSVQSSVIVCDGRELESKIYDNINLAENNRNLAEASLQSSVVLLEEAKDFLANVSTILERALPLQMLLENATEQVEHHRGILARINPRYIQKFVIPAAEHADFISQQALYLSNLFSSTYKASQFPLIAAKVYEDIIDNIELAEQIAGNAYSAADRAYYEVNTGRKNSLTRQGIEIKKISLDLKEDADNLKQYFLAVQMALERRQKVINKTAEDINLVINSLTEFKEDIDALPRDIGDQLHNIEDKHMTIREKMAAVHSQIDMLMNLINDDLYSKLDGLRVGSSAGLFNVTQTIDLLKSTTKKAVKKEGNVEKRVERIKVMNSKMKLSVQDLKNKILLARQKTSNIRVSLSSDSAGICVRSFRPEIEPTSTSSIVLHYAIKTEEKDSLLLFLASSETMTRTTEPE
ncbi:Laminin subunit alpha-2, partial [Stegodyphus mimosarum]